jgi:AAA15 family ATPase/GTPase
MIESFSVERYRNLNLKNVRFQDVNVIIGPNNSGKSNLIDAIHFISNILAAHHHPAVTAGL